MSEIIDLLQLIVLLFIAKHLTFHDRYRYQVLFSREKPRFVVWRLKWNYKEQGFYMDKIVIKL